MNGGLDVTHGAASESSGVAEFDPSPRRINIEVIHPQTVRIGQAVAVVPIKRGHDIVNLSRAAGESRHSIQQIHILYAIDPSLKHAVSNSRRGKFEVVFGTMPRTRILSFFDVLGPGGIAT